MQIGIVLYAIIEERCLRESPGVLWAVSTWIIFMVNNITMWPLLKYFRGPEVQRVLFKLAYSFIISFQGIHAVAWSYQYPWLYWVVMPYWFWSVKKLFESYLANLSRECHGAVELQDAMQACRSMIHGILKLLGAPPAIEKQVKWLTPLKMKGDKRQQEEEMKGTLPHRAVALASEASSAWQFCCDPKICSDANWIDPGKLYIGPFASIRTLGP
eukprot:symbB.v1.2.003275.t1/scaffold184.1/size280901/3